MDHLVDRLFIFEGDGQIRLFNGNYSDYRSWVEENELQEVAVPTQVKEIPIVASDTKRKPSFKEKQEYDKLQEDIESLEKQKETLTIAISSGSTDHQELQK